jgi:alcohol dehydrogenase class IV
MTASKPIGLRKFVAPEITFGEGARHLAGRYAKNLGTSRVLLVTDPGVIAAGWTRDVSESLEAGGIQQHTFSGVTPNPRAEEVAAGARVYKEAQCNGIIAVGGGSPIDCAKGIGIVSSCGGDILDFEGVDQVSSPMPPLICIPTTGGTSADVSQFAIITNVQERVKIAIISKAVVPDVSLIDPETLTSMSERLAAATAIDALVHAIEAYVSSAHSPVTDVHALEAMRLISRNILGMMQKPEDMELRNRIMLGSLEAGLAFSNASLGATHAMAHSLGGLLDLPHGECNAMLLNHVIAFNHPAVEDRYQVVAQAMGLDFTGMAAQQQRKEIFSEVRRLRTAVGIRETLGDVGVHRTDVGDLAKHAIKDPCIITNPRRPNQRDIEVIYEESL